MSTGLSDHERVAGAGGACSDDDCVMTLHEWARRAGIAYVTARRVIAAGQGPEVVRLSPNRLGVSFGAHRAWLKSRVTQPA
jgi:hypothetical protein